MTGWSTLFATGLILAAFYDVRERRIPNRIVGPLLVAGLAAQLVQQGGRGVGDGLLGVLVAGGPLLIPFGLRWLGAGDVKLMASVGMWLGARGGAFALGIGLVLGAVVSLAIAARRRALLGEVMRNLYLTAVTLEPPAPAARPQRETVPMGLAFSVGALAALALTGKV